MSVETIQAGSMFLLPPHKDKCQECAVTHDVDQPHNAQSMFYQVKFKMDHGRDPSWLDAMAHCTDQTKQVWTDGLTAAGVDVASGKINPTKGK